MVMWSSVFMIWGHVCKCHCQDVVAMWDRERPAGQLVPCHPEGGLGMEVYGSNRILAPLARGSFNNSIIKAYIILIYIQTVRSFNVCTLYELIRQSSAVPVMIAHTAIAAGHHQSRHALSCCAGELSHLAGCAPTGAAALSKNGYTPTRDGYTPTRDGYTPTRVHDGRVHSDRQPSHHDQSRNTASFVCIPLMQCRVQGAQEARPPLFCTDLSLMYWHVGLLPTA